MSGPGYTTYTFSDSDIDRIEAKIRAATIEECAKVADAQVSYYGDASYGDNPDDDDWSKAAIQIGKDIRALLAKATP